VSPTISIEFDVIKHDIHLEPIIAVSAVVYIPEANITDISNGVIYENGIFIIPDGVVEFTFKDGDKEMKAYKEGNENWAFKELGVDKDYSMVAKVLGIIIVLGLSAYIIYVIKRRSWLLLIGRRGEWIIVEVIDDKMKDKLVIKPIKTTKDFVELKYDENNFITDISNKVIFDRINRKFIVPKDIEDFTFTEGTREMMAKKVR